MVVIISAPLLHLQGFADLPAHQRGIESAGAEDGDDLAGLLYGIFDPAGQVGAVGPLVERRRERVTCTALTEVEDAGARLRSALC